MARKKLIEVALPLEASNREPDFGVTSVHYDCAELLRKAEAPR